MTGVALIAPFAQAQLGITPAVPAFTLEASPQSADAFPNETATFTLTVGNPSPLLDRVANMTLVSQLPAGWTYNFSRDAVAVAANGTNTTLLSIFIGDNPPGSFNVTFEADDEYSEFTRASVVVTVKERPASTRQQSVVAPPAFALSISTGDSGESGETIRGTLTIQNQDSARPTLRVQIVPVASGGWTPFVRDSDRNRVLAPGATAAIPVFVQVPPLSENASHTLEIRVTSEGTTKTIQWTVLGIAPEPAVFDPARPATGAPSGGTSTGSRGGSSAGPLQGPNLDMYVEPLEVSIPSGGQQTAIVHLVNTGDSPLTVTLAGEPPSTWRPFSFAPATPIELGPGDRADVSVTLTAPDVPPGGATSSKIYAIDDGFVRSASFVIRTTASAPRDTTQASSAETVSAPEGGAPVASSTLLVVGLAAVGGAAAIVASRPLRHGAIWLGVGLYTRLARPDVLGHEDREKLYRLVETQPGIHFHALQRDLGWNTGTLTYHLRVLERHTFVVSRRDGLYRRFYLSGAAPRKETFENQGPTGLRADVLEAVKNTPGISQTDLALGLGANKQTVNYHVKALERGGSIRVEKRGRDTYLYPATAASEPGSASVRA